MRVDFIPQGRLKFTVESVAASNNIDWLGFGNALVVDRARINGYSGAVDASALRLGFGAVTCNDFESEIISHSEHVSVADLVRWTYRVKRWTCAAASWSSAGYNAVGMPGDPDYEPAHPPVVHDAVSYVYTPVVVTVDEGGGPIDELDCANEKQVAASGPAYLQTALVSLIDNILSGTEYDLSISGMPIFASEETPDSLLGDYITFNAFPGSPLMPWRLDSLDWHDGSDSGEDSFFEPSGRYDPTGLEGYTGAEPHLQNYITVTSRFPDVISLRVLVSPEELFPHGTTADTAPTGVTVFSSGPFRLGTLAVTLTAAEYWEYRDQDGNNPLFDSATGTLL